VGDIEPFSEPIITVTFDDGWESAYSEGFKVLEKYNIKTTQYILGGHFGDEAYLSEEQVHSMQEAGHEIAAHSMTHPDLTSLTEDKVEWELGESDRVLSDKFGAMREFATPLGASNDMVLKHLKKYYRSHRNTIGDATVADDTDINIGQTFNRYNINAFTIRKSTTYEELKNLIDYTIQRKGWLVITYHQVDDSSSDFAVAPKTLASQLQLIREKQIRTATLGQVLDAIEKRSKPCTDSIDGPKMLRRHIATSTPTIPELWLHVI
jgi:peptidoglycan/xylan/chitin deacetylase (PgdA/CDA1 family)